VLSHNKKHRDDICKPCSYVEPCLLSAPLDKGCMICKLQTTMFQQLASQAVDALLDMAYK
jgi:hypothetical protein